MANTKLAIWQGACIHHDKRYNHRVREHPDLCRDRVTAARGRVVVPLGVRIAHRTIYAVLYTQVPHRVSACTRFVSMRDMHTRTLALQSPRPRKCALKALSRRKPRRRSSSRSVSQNSNSCTQCACAHLISDTNPLKKFRKLQPGEIALQLLVPYSTSAKF